MTSASSSPTESGYASATPPAGLTPPFPSGIAQEILSQPPPPPPLNGACLTGRVVQAPKVQRIENVDADVARVTTPKPRRRLVPTMPSIREEIEGETEEWVDASRDAMRNFCTFLKKTNKRHKEIIDCANELTNWENDVIRRTDWTLTAHEGNEGLCLQLDLGGQTLFQESSRIFAHYTEGQLVNRYELSVLDCFSQT